jgi:arylsulfatase
MRSTPTRWVLGLVAALLFAAPLSAQDKPNVLIIWGDDIGWSNTSAYNHGIMGYETPNIDRIAHEGAMFTDWYAQQSCTAGRAAFILGQHPFRTGLLTIGMPGSDQGIRDDQPTIADLLKPLGYTSGQFGKNHLGDRDEHLPTAHGFDEFFGNLYHLNAEEEPETYYYPKDPSFREKYGPRGVIHSYSDGRIEDTGPLTRKRMETVDEEFLTAAIAFIEQAHAEGKPFFVWYNSTRMHVFTRLKPESEAVTGIGLYPDGMVELDGMVGILLDKLDELGITDNTIVMFSTDNGAETFTWPDGGTTIFRGEKNTNWEGGYRVPAMVRWPGQIVSGQVSNEIISQLDWMPTFLAAAGEPNVKAELLAGKQVGDRSFKVHLDGYNFLPYLLGETAEAPRREFFYFSDDGNLVGLRYNNWKIVFAEQRAHGMNVWQDPFTQLRLPKIFNLRTDPFERADHEAIGYGEWRFDRLFLLVPAQAFVGNFLGTFLEFPPRQKPSSFSIDQVLESMQKAGTQ